MSYAPNLITQIKPPNTKQIIADALNSPYSSGRTALLSMDARRDGRVDDKDWEEYNKFVYLRWYNHFKNMSQEDIDKLLVQYNVGSTKKDGTKTSASERVAEYSERIDAIRNSPKYRPEEIEKNSNYFYFLSNECNSEKLSGLRPYKNQDGVFFHVMSLPSAQEEGDTQFRLYLNISASNITNVSKGLMQKCDKQNLPVYFKTAVGTNESDVIVIYTSFKDAQRLVEVLKELKNEKPQWFIGAEKTAKSEGQIAGFIGCGEEPAYKHSSYNAERGEVIESLKTDYIIDNAKQVTTPNFTSKGLINNSKGEEQSLIQYLQYKLKDVVMSNAEYEKKNLDIDFASEDNVIAMRNFAIRTMRKIIDGTEDEKSRVRLTDKTGMSHLFGDLQTGFTQKLLDVFGINQHKDPLKNKDELLEMLFRDKKGGGYNQFCFEMMKQEVINESTARISKNKNGFVDGAVDPTTKAEAQIPISTYQSIIQAVQQGEANGNRLVNKAVYNHILDLYEVATEINDHRENPQKHKKPTSVTSSCVVKFKRGSMMQDIKLFGLTTQALSGYMQQAGIEPIMPTESRIREECLKRDVSYDNFCLNESSMQKFIAWQKKQANSDPV